MRENEESKKRITIQKYIEYDPERKLYYVTFYHGKVNGKYLRERKTFTTKKEAQNALKLFEADKVKGITTAPNQKTLSEWLDYWIDKVITPNRAKTTVYGYSQIIKNHLKPKIGDIPLTKLSPIHITEYYADILNEKGLTSNTVRKHHDLLKAALTVAVKLEKIYRNPTENVEPPKVLTVERRYYNQEQLKALFTVVKENRIELVVMLAGYCGLRREEICGLKWKNVDLVNHTFKIVEVRTSAGSEIIEKETKTIGSTRTEYIASDNLLDAFKRARKAYVENKIIFGDEFIDDGYVVAYPNGKPYRPNYLSELFTKFIKEHNLPIIYLHELRHTFASIANDIGVPIYNIGRAMGHTTPSTTSKVYTHLLDDDHRETMSRVSAEIDRESNSLQKTLLGK